MRMTNGMPLPPSHVPGPVRESHRPQARSSTPLPSIQYYTVRAGDTLRGLAMTFYRNPAEWVRIYNSNMSGTLRADQAEGPIRNPNRIDAGMVLIIPN